MFQTSPLPRQCSPSEPRPRPFEREVTRAGFLGTHRETRKRRARPTNTCARHRFLPERPAQTVGGAFSFTPPPAFRKRRHRSLARRLIAVRRRATLVVPESQRPYPRRSIADADFKDAASHNAV